VAVASRIQRSRHSGSGSSSLSCKYGRYRFRTVPAGCCTWRRS